VALSKHHSRGRRKLLAEPLTDPVRWIEPFDEKE